MTFYEGLTESLTEASEFAKGEKKLRKTKVTIHPVHKYTAKEIKAIRQSQNMSQTVFAGYLGVSNQTVESWEKGDKSPSGTACRLLSMLESDRELPNKYPFIDIITN